MNFDGILKKQFRLDTNCETDSPDGININKRKRLKGSRYFADISDFFRAIIYRGSLYMMCDEQIYDWALCRYADYSPEWFCKYENLRVLDEKLNEYGYGILDTHIYYMPDEDYIGYDFECPYDIVWLYKEEIEKLRDNNPFRHALMYMEGCPDVMAVAAKNGDEMIAMAGVSADSDALYQIGVDVLGEYKHKGLAVYLTSLMKQKVMDMGRVPFYGTSESHAVSSRVAIRSGFIPAWCEVYSRCNPAPVKS